MEEPGNSRLVGHIQKKSTRLRNAVTSFLIRTAVLWMELNLAGYPRCATQLTVHFTVNDAGLKNIWFVGYTTMDISSHHAGVENMVCRVGNPGH